MPTNEITAAAAGTWTLGDLTVNRMGFGSMRITANPDRATAIRVLRRAVELGVNHIDTAAFYFSPGGILGRRERPDPVRHRADPRGARAVPGGSGDHHQGRARRGPRGRLLRHHAAQLRGQVEENLRRLGRDHLDVVNLRIVKAGPGLDRRAVRRTRRDARRRADPPPRHLQRPADHLDEAQAIAPVVCVQNSYSIDTNRTDDEFVRPAANGASRSSRSSRSPAAEREAGATAEHSEAVRAVALAHGQARSRYGWPGRCTRATRPGHPRHRRPGHLEENIAAGALRLSPDELARLG